MMRRGLRKRAYNVMKEEISQSVGAFTQGLRDSIKSPEMHDHMMPLYQRLLVLDWDCMKLLDSLCVKTRERTHILEPLLEAIAEGESFLGLAQFRIKKW